MKFIKSILPFLFLAMTLSLVSTSCKKDDDTKPATLAESLIGKWNITSQVSDGVESIGVFINSASIEFKSGNKTTLMFDVIGAGILSDEGTYTVDEAAKKVTFIDSDGDQSINTVVLDGNKVTFTEVDVDGIITVVKATKL